MRPSKLLLLSFMFVSLFSFGQLSKDYREIIHSNKVDKTILIKNKVREREITFLGIVKTNNGKTKYYTLKEFERVRASSTWHGHSSLYFIDMDFKTFIRYDLGMPYNLPLRLSNNDLVFEYDDGAKKKKRYLQNLKAKLPSNICVAPLDCYPHDN